MLEKPAPVARKNHTPHLLALLWNLEVFALQTVIHSARWVFITDCALWLLFLRAYDNHAISLSLPVRFPPRILLAFARILAAEAAEKVAAVVGAETLRNRKGNRTRARGEKSPTAKR